jgi:hypothetical protein
MTDKEWSVLEAFRNGYAAAVSPALPSVVPGWGKPGNPHKFGTEENLAWTLGYREGKKQQA